MPKRFPSSDAPVWRSPYADLRADINHGVSVCIDFADLARDCGQSQFAQDRGTDEVRYVKNRVSGFDAPVVRRATELSMIARRVSVLSARAERDGYGADAQTIIRDQVWSLAHEAISLHEDPALIAASLRERDEQDDQGGHGVGLRTLKVRSAPDALNGKRRYNRDRDLKGNGENTLRYSEQGHVSVTPAQVIATALATAKGDRDWN